MLGSTIMHLPALRITDERWEAAAPSRSRHHCDLPQTHAHVLVHRHDYLQGLEIPTVILTSRRRGPAERPRPGTGLGQITRASEGQP